MLTKNHPVILFIDRFGFSVYQDVLTNIPKFNFTSDLVSNMDVVNGDQFKSLIATFIQINKMVPSCLVIILSDDIIYIKDLAASQKAIPAQGAKVEPVDDREHQEDIRNFLEDIPFEEVMAKTIRIGEANRVVAVNRDLVMTIMNVFTGKGFAIEAVIPGFMYGQSASFSAGLTASNIPVILGNAETLKLGNLLTDQEKAIPTQGLGGDLKTAPAEKAKKPQGMRQFILIGVFITLLILLGVVYLNLGASQAIPKSYKLKSSDTAANGANASIVTPTSTQVLPTIAVADLKTVNIKISYSSQFSATAANLKNSLSALGFQNMLDEITEVAIPEKSSVTFSQSIPETLRNSIVTEMKKILPNITILGNQEPNPTINILIGKS